MPHDTPSPAIGKLLLIGWRSADWDSLHPLIDAGHMPHLRALIESGSAATVSSILPVGREPFWTSIATGWQADRHGVAAPLEIRPDGGGVQPIGRRSWRAPALWDILEAAGHRTVCIGWPATSPADRWPGMHVDEHFALAAGSRFDEWELPAHAISPAPLRDELADMRLHPSEVAPEQLASLVPADNVTANQRAAGMLAQAASVHAAACHIMQTTDWSAMFVCYELLHHAKRLFGGVASAPEGMAWEDCQRAIAGSHGLADMMLGRLVELAGPDVTVMLVSPNGLRVRPQRELSARMRGMLVAAGPGIAVDRLLPGLRSVDVAPTVLARFGLAWPCDGRVIAALAPIGSLHEVTMPPPPPEPPDPAAALLAAGYPDVLDPAQTAAVDAAEIERLVNIAEAQAGRGDHGAALASLRGALDQQPRHPRALQRTAYSAAALGDTHRLRQVAETLLAIDPALPWGHLEMAAWCLLTGTPAEAAEHLVRARERAGGHRGAFVRLGGFALLQNQPQDAAGFFTTALAILPDAPDALYGLGMARQALGDLPGAEQALRRGALQQHQAPLLHLQLGLLLAGQRRWNEARLALETALDQRPDLAEAQAALAELRAVLAHDMLPG